VSDCAGQTSTCPIVSNECNLLVSPYQPPTGPPNCTQVFSECDITHTYLPFAVCFRSDERKANLSSLPDLNQLRRQLTVALALVSRRERALSIALTPKTPTQMAAAETHLLRALDDLKKAKQFVQARAAAKKKVTKPGTKAKAAPVKKATGKKAVARKTAAKKKRP
jgi:hypothetical protein